MEVKINMVNYYLISNFEGVIIITVIIIDINWDYIMADLNILVIEIFINCHINVYFHINVITKNMVSIIK